MGATKSRTIVLARRIAELAIRSAWPRGRRVTEMELARALGVSRTPIRSAMGVLVSEGALKPRENRGFCLSKDGLDLARLHLEAAPGASDVLYALVVKDRLADSLPAVVAPSMLQKRYAVSRPVLEQVMARLEADGLLMRGSGRDWRFVETMNDEGSVTASYDVRIILEPAALTLPSARLDADFLQSLRGKHRDMLAAIEAITRSGAGKRRATSPRSRAVALDAEFHIGLAGLSRNPFILATIRHQVALRRLLEHKVSADPWHVATWCREHLSVLDELIAGNREAAVAALRAHLERARREALAGLHGVKTSSRAPARR